MEEVGITSFEREAREEMEEEIKTLKVQLESLDTEIDKVRERADKLDAELKMAREGWRTAEEKANQRLIWCNELEGSILVLVKEAKSAKEKEMREMVLPVEISKALADFKVEDMAAEI